MDKFFRLLHDRIFSRRYVKVYIHRLTAFIENVISGFNALACGFAVQDERASIFPVGTLDIFAYFCWYRNPGKIIQQAVANALAQMQIKIQSKPAIKQIQNPNTK